jgi:hypothetical protein
VIRRTLKNKPGVLQKINTAVHRGKTAAQATLRESEADLERSKKQLQELKDARTNTR